MAPDRKSLTMPVSRNRAGLLHARLQQLGTLENAHTFNSSKNPELPSVRPAILYVSVLRKINHMLLHF